MCPSNNFYPEQHRGRKCLIKPWPPETHWAVQAKLIGCGQGDMSKASTPPSSKGDRKSKILPVVELLCREESSCLLEEEATIAAVKPERTMEVV